VKIITPTGKSVIPPTDTSEPSDASEMACAARSLGLKSVRAWVPDIQKKNKTDGAQRTKRSLEKAENQGLKQLSITLPAELHPMLKTLAALSSR